MWIIITSFPDDGRNLEDKLDLPTDEARRLINDGRARRAPALPESKGSTKKVGPKVEESDATDETPDPPSES